jgi:hypothetical protein
MSPILENKKRRKMVPLSGPLEEIKGRSVRVGEAVKGKVLRMVQSRGSVEEGLIKRESVARTATQEKRNSSAVHSNRTASIRGRSFVISLHLSGNLHVEMLRQLLLLDQPSTALAGCYREIT